MRNWSIDGAGDVMCPEKRLRHGARSSLCARNSRLVGRHAQGIRRMCRRRDGQRNMGGSGMGQGPSPDVVSKRRVRAWDKGRLPNRRGRPRRAAPLRRPRFCRLLVGYVFVCLSSPPTLSRENLFHYCRCLLLCPVLPFPYSLYNGILASFFHECLGLGAYWEPAALFQG